MILSVSNERLDIGETEIESHVSSLKEYIGTEIKEIKEYIGNEISEIKELFTAQSLSL